MKKRFVVVPAVMAVFWGWGLVGFAAEYPNKPINLVIQYAPGGSTDLASRALAKGAQKYLGQPIICENKAGGGGTVGPVMVISKPPDGYTLGIVTSSPAMAYHMGKLNFHPLNDLTPIMRWGNYLVGLVVRSDSQFKTLQDVIDYAKQNPEKLSYASPGVGTPAHLSMEELCNVANVKFTHIPTKGGAEDNTALLGGHVDLVSDGGTWAPLVDAGKFRLLAIWHEKRCERYPQVPTARELGYEVLSHSHLGVMGPKGLPKPIVARLADAFTKAMDDPEFKATLKKFDMPAYYANTEDYEKYFRSDFEDIEKLVKRLGLDKKP
jgi:tripartite-type tricarboxylate transporter receptor subunit TctC